jgi:hypothetical protein
MGLYYKVQQIEGKCPSNNQTLTLFAKSFFRYKKLVVNRILNDAFVELLEWDDYFALPESLAMDAKRIIALRDAVERMAVSTGVILLVINT